MTDREETINVTLTISRNTHSTDGQVKEGLERALRGVTAYGYDGGKYCVAVINKAQTSKPLPCKLSG